MEPVPQYVIDRLWSNVVIGDIDQCWPWTACTVRGYGTVTFGGRTHHSHRVVYIITFGDPGDLHVDHTCHTPACTLVDNCPHRACNNPHHLEAVTCRENLLRGNTIAAINLAKTHCPAGHEYTPENTRITPQGWRLCRTCRKAERRARYEKSLLLVGHN